MLVALYSFNSSHRCCFGSGDLPPSKIRNNPRKFLFFKNTKLIASSDGKQFFFFLPAVLLYLYYPTRVTLYICNICTCPVLVPVQVITCPAPGVPQCTHCTLEFSSVPCAQCKDHTRSSPLRYPHLQFLPEYCLDSGKTIFFMRAIDINAKPNAARPW